MRRIKAGGWFLLMLVAGSFLAAPVVAQDKAPKAKEKLVVMGWVEKAVLFPSRVQFLAKLDTGARTTSINADDVSRFEKNGRQWVRFTIRNRNGDEATFERPIVRIARIKRTGVKAVERIVVSLRICIGKFKTLAQVNLANRRNMLYQLLIGRRFMQGRILVDSDKKYLASAECD